MYNQPMDEPGRLIDLELGNLVVPELWPTWLDMSVEEWHELKWLTVKWHTRLAMAMGWTWHCQFGH